MNSMRWLALAAIAVMALGAGLLWMEQRGASVNAVTVAVDGPPGSVVSIITDVDGETTTSETPLPTSLERTVKVHFTITVNLIDGPGGPIHAEMTVGGSSKGSVTSNRGVIGRLELDGDKIRLSSLSGL